MVKLTGVLAAVAALFAAGVAVSALAARSDAPLKSQTYTDAAGDQTPGSPDLTSIVVDNKADGTIDFSVALPQLPALVTGDGFIVQIDADQSAATGDGGFDVLLTADGNYPSLTSIEIYKWNGAKWVVQGRAPGLVDGSFTGLAGVTWSVAASTLNTTTGFRFRVKSIEESADGHPHGDDAPAPPDVFTYTLGGLAATTSTAATTTTTVTTTPKPKPKPLARCKKGQLSTKKHPCRHR